MDAYLLRYFCVVAEMESIRKASELLGISSAACSKAMKLLQEQTNQKLFVPSGRGILITDAGHDLARRARPVLENLDALLSPHRSSRGNAAGRVSPLRIGTFEVFSTYFMGVLLTEHLPDMEVVLHELIPGELERGLAAKEIDLGITYLPIPTAGVEHLRVASTKFGIYVKRGAFEATRFEDLPFAAPLSPIGRTPTRAKGLDGWPDDRVERKVRFWVTLMESALELCRQGLCAAYLPDFVVRLHNVHTKWDLQLVKLTRPLVPRLDVKPQDVYLARRKADVTPMPVPKIARALRLLLHGHAAAPKT